MEKLPKMFEKHLSKWWLALIVGVLGIVLGVKMLVKPIDSFAAMSTLFIVFFIAYGVIETIQVIINRKEIPAWGWNLVAAIVPIILGIMIWCMPLGSELLLTTFFSVGIVFEGIYLIMNSIANKGSGWVLSLILGILVTLIGFSVLGSPLMSVVIIGYLAAFAFLFTGINFVTMAIIMSKTKSALKRKK